MSKKKKNYHKKNKNQQVQQDVKTKSSLNLYILIGMIVVGAASIIYLSSK
ncbi:hypothetical protein [Bacteriovorax sp. DB6_IX]|nr:hypothetical protein [Bacteriovorax sp. DB6_IX]EQC51234.1 hypothetical protein M901_1801 [Bacteriovorax sp. DB6_IX]